MLTASSNPITVDYLNSDCKNLDFKHQRIYIDFLENLVMHKYRFITVTPLTHTHAVSQKVLANTLCDIFGWNLPFKKESLNLELFKLLNSVEALEVQGPLLRSKVRVSSVADDLFLHSSFPTIETDSVFFGPDTYRFARLIRQELQNKSDFLDKNKLFRILDIGCGSGAGGIVAVRQLSHLYNIELTMNDINPKALEFAAVNAAVAKISVKLALGDALSVVQGNFDLIISNPPYLDDVDARAYRHGGDNLGRAFSVQIVQQSLNRLALNGRLILYTGVAIVDDFDPFFREILPLLNPLHYEWFYEEIDPDIFGEELSRPNYACAQRIAAVSLIIKRK
ncbi:MAG: class I SAM-dependent methyltransferase [Pseudomonadota bacterium]